MTCCCVNNPLPEPLLITNGSLWQSPDTNLQGAFKIYQWVENYTFQITARSSTGQWLKAPNCWRFVRWLVDAANEGPVRWKVWPWHDVPMCQFIVRGFSFSHIIGIWCNVVLTLPYCQRHMRNNYHYSDLKYDIGLTSKNIHFTMSSSV